MLPIGLLLSREPQGNAMLSVRVTAAGAVMVASLSLFAAPVRACDDRYAAKCEKAAAAEFAAAEAQTEAPVKRRHAKAVVLRGRHARAAARERSAEAPAKRQRGMSLASAESRPVSLPGESVLSRRFRGFIDPQPISQNSFEALRKPHLVALNMEPNAAMTVAANTAAPATEPAAVAATTESVEAAAKQDRIAQVATTDAPPTVTKQVALTDALAPKPVAQAEAIAAPAQVQPQPAAPVLAAAYAAPQTEVSEAAPQKPDDSRFPVHKLVLALCGALGAASALRFIVRA